MDIGLVLGGGGARGYAHIGVLRALLEHDCQPVAISGCSMGGLVGAFFAAGKSPDEILALVEKLNFFNLLDMGALGGLVGTRKLEALLREHLPERFEDLELPLAVTVVDVQRGELLILRSGDLPTALLASAALPGILGPVKRNGRYLVDGGLLNNLPVDVIKTMTLEAIVAVDVAAPPSRHLTFEDTEKNSEKDTKKDSGKDTEKDTEEDLGKRFQGLFSGGMQGLADNLKGMFAASSFDLFKRSLTIELFMKSFDVPQAVLTKMRLALQPPALLITPELDPQFGVESFERLTEAVDAGYDAAVRALADFVADTTTDPAMNPATDAVIDA